VQNNQLTGGFPERWHTSLPHKYLGTFGFQSMDYYFSIRMCACVFDLVRSHSACFSVFCQSTWTFPTTNSQEKFLEVSACSASTMKEKQWNFERIVTFVIANVSATDGAPISGRLLQWRNAKISPCAYIDRQQ